MADPVATNQVDVCNAIVTRLIAEISGFNASTCFLTCQPLQELPENIKTGAVVCSVSPAGGPFDESAYAGGGENVLIEDAAVHVVLYNNVRTDRRRHDVESLTKASEGLLTVKRLVLKALAGHRLQDGSSNELLVEHGVMPIQSDSPRSQWDDEKRRGIGDIGLLFRTPFLWDLS